MHQCPKCESGEIHRSHAKSTWESWRKAVTRKRPYRCRACGWRGWCVDLGPKFRDDAVELASRALTPEPPHPKGTPLAAGERTLEIKVEELDVLERIVAKNGDTSNSE